MLCNISHDKLNLIVTDYRLSTLISNPNHASEACVHCALPSSITSALDPTLSTSQLVTIEIFSPALCFSAHTNNYFYFLHDVSTLTFCINVLPRLIVNG